jgi:hypothetical protein
MMRENRARAMEFSNVNGASLGARGGNSDLMKCVSTNEDDVCMHVKGMCERDVWLEVGK